MKPYHVKVHAFGVDRVTAELARHRDGRVCNRLLQQRFGSLLSPVLGFMSGLFTFWSLTILQ